MEQRIEFLYKVNRDAIDTIKDMDDEQENVCSNMDDIVGLVDWMRDINPLLSFEEYLYELNQTWDAIQSIAVASKKQIQMQQENTNDIVRSLNMSNYIIADTVDAGDE